MNLFLMDLWAGKSNQDAIRFHDWRGIHSSYINGSFPLCADTVEVTMQLQGSYNLLISLMMPIYSITSQKAPCSSHHQLEG